MSQAKMNIQWLEDAVSDLDSLRRYIAKDSAHSANFIARRILHAIELLSEQPGIGRPGRVPNTRELIVSSTPYIVPYRVKSNNIEVLRVLHCAMKWPDEL